LVTALSSLVYWSGIIFQKSKKDAPSYKTYATNAGQQKVLTLSDGTKIRLNEQSSLRIPRQFGVKDRKVKLKGEAYFQVAHDKGHPFIIEANGATIKDLDTQFDVKADSAAGKVQVAVIRGRVLLKKEQKDSTGRTASAILTRNHLGILQLSDSQITIEKGGARNYLSWKTHRLVFKGLTLVQVSRQLQRLYNVHIQFRSSRVKKLQLTATLNTTKLKNVLNIIARTLDIHYRMHKSHIVWEP